MKKLDRFLDILATYASGHFAGWLVVVMTCLVMVEVVTRYVMRRPLMVADEFSGYMLAAMSFIGLAYTWKEKGHIRIEVLIGRLPRRIAKWVRLVTLLGVCVFMPVLGKAIFDLVIYSWRWDMRSASWLRTPLVWPQMLMAFGALLFLVMLIGQLIKTIHAIRTGEGEEV
ncbi:MAG: TRAP transporter small permease [Chloroflexota bacterium]|nr:TRAP transporter small permease [Chloroflexota bacterium]